MSAETSPEPPKTSLRNQPLSRPPSLVAMVTARLRDAIISAEFKLGEAISEDRLATAFGVSRTPVREALTALQLQGLINIQPQRGSFVFFPDEAEVAALCEFRMIMETRAMELALARNRDRTVAQLRAANEAMERAAASNDPLAFTKADSDVHAALFANCGNQFLAEAYALMSGRIDALRTHLSTPQNSVGAGSILEHQEIIAAFAGGNVERAEQLLSGHIFKMRERFASALASNTLGQVQ